MLFLFHYCVSLAAFSRRSHAQTTVNALIVYRLFVDNTHKKTKKLQQKKFDTFDWYVTAFLLILLLAFHWFRSANNPSPMRGESLSLERFFGSFFSPFDWITFDGKNASNQKKFNCWMQTGQHLLLQISLSVTVLHLSEFRQQWIFQRMKWFFSWLQFWILNVPIRQLEVVFSGFSS